MQKTEPTFQASLGSVAGPCLNIPPRPQKSLAGFKLQQAIVRHSKSQGGFAVVKGRGLSWHRQGSSKTGVQAHPPPNWCDTRGLQGSRATSLWTSLLLAAMCTRHGPSGSMAATHARAQPVLLHPLLTPPTPTLPDAPYEDEAPRDLTTEAEPGKSTAWLPPCRLVLSGSSCCSESFAGAGGERGGAK